MRYLLIVIVLISLSGCGYSEIKLGPSFLQTVYETCNGTIPFSVKIDCETRTTEVTCLDRSVHKFTAEE